MSRRSFCIQPFYKVIVRVNLKRYLFVIVTAALAGAGWASVSGEFPSARLEHVSSGYLDVLNLSPFVVHVLCGAFLKWWRAKAIAIYSLIVATLFVVGDAYNERVYGCACCNDTSSGKWVIIWIIVTTITAMAWGIGFCMQRTFAWRTGGRQHPFRD